MIDTLIDKIEARKAKKSAGWWFKVVTVVLVALVVLVLAVRVWLRKGEIATYKTKKAIADNAKARAKAQADIELSLSKRNQALDRAEVAAKKVFESSRKIEEIELAHKQEKEILSRIKSWEDVDKYVR